MTISKIKAVEKLIKFGLDKYYGERIHLLACERNTLLNNSHDLVLDHLRYNVNHDKVSPDDIEILEDGYAVYTFEIPEIADRLEEIDHDIEELNNEYAEKLQTLENWVNFAIVNDNSLVDAPTIPEELKAFYDIAVMPFQED